MTIEEKRNALDMYCDAHEKCNGCGLSVIASRGELCYSEGADVERNYALIFSEEKNIVNHPVTKLELHAMICDEIKELYRKKNADYGDSFHTTFVEEGMAMPRIRLTDKLERFKRLTKSNEQNVKDESVRDTLIDLANYAIMTVLEMECEQKDAEK